jgi:hypothetical protein
MRLLIICGRFYIVKGNKQLVYVNVVVKTNVMVHVQVKRVVQVNVLVVVQFVVPMVKTMILNV